MTSQEQFDAINVPTYLNDLKAKVNDIREAMSQSEFDSPEVLFMLYEVPHKAQLHENEVEVWVGSLPADDPPYLYHWRAPINWLSDPLP